MRLRKNFFTLVELIAAMAILMMTALIIGTASMTFYNGWQRTVRVTDKLRTNLNIDRFMDSCVRNLFAFRWQDDQLVWQYVFDGRKDSMLFVCFRRAFQGDPGGMLFVKLFAEDQKLVADYSFYPRFQWSEEGTLSWTREILAENVSGISFLYANLDTNDELEWLDEWREYSDSGVQEEDDFLPVPLAVQLKVEYTDSTSEVWLRRTLGNSKNSELILP